MLQRLLDIQSFRIILAAVWNSSRWWTVSHFIILLLLSALPLVGFVLLKDILDVLTQSNAPITLLQLRGPIIALAVVLVLTSLLQNLSAYITEVQEQLIQDYMSGIIQEKSITLDMAYYDNPAFFDTLHRAQEEAAYRPSMILQAMMSLVQSLLSVAAVGVLLAAQHWGIALLLVVTAIPAVLIKIKYSRKLYEVQRNTTRLNRRSWYLSMVLTRSEYAKELRLFEYGAQLRGWFKGVRKQLFDTKRYVQWQRSVASGIVQALEALAFVAALAYAIHLSVIGQLTVGGLILYYQVFQRGQASLQQFLNSLVQLYHNQLFIRNIGDFLDLKPAMNRLQPFEDTPLSIQEILIKNLSFQYPNADKWVLKNIDLNIKKGQVIALVGENGSGKTTLIKLLCRLYDATEGSIFINGKDIRHFDTAAWRHRMTVIFQDFTRYHFTVKDNIGIGNIHAIIDDERVRTAAERTTAHQFIQSFPHQYDTVLGKEYAEGGTELSGGQWQKIALARAFYKDADIIVLDEPTSAIDPLAEHDIFMQFKDMARDKILILITHRLYNLKSADCIFVLDKGSIVESGTHDALLQLRGGYFKMFDKQL
jgi:ATP-binding cassette, subfamily B, bacterial